MAPLLNPSFFAVICLCGFGATELVLRRGADAKSLDVGAADRSTSLHIVLAYAVCAVLLAVAPFVPLAKIALAGCWAAVAVAALGLALRWWSMSTLGHFYTRTLRTVSDQQIVQAGPYRLLRHPGYLGSLLIWIGASLTLAPPLIAGAVGVVLAIVYTSRIRSEEQMLRGQFGQVYATYCEGTWRLVPYIY